MGASASSSSGSSCDADKRTLEKTVAAPSGTPIRVLGIDPRSPSNEINRTPLQAEDCRDKNVVVMCDPRSPTYCIERTPLAVQQNLKQSTPVTNNERAIKKQLDYAETK